MSDLQKTNEPKNLPRLVCAFAGLFALAVPAFSVVVGSRLQTALGEIILVSTGAHSIPTVSATILDSCKIASWGLLAVGLISAISLFLLLLKNSTAGTLRGAGRIVLALGLTGSLSVFYLASLLFSVALPL